MPCAAAGACAPDPQTCAGRFRKQPELEARQSWTVNAARLAVAAPWVVLLLIGTQPAAVETYRTAAGAGVLAVGLIVSVACYQLMLRIGALPQDERVIA